MSQMEFCRWSRELAMEIVQSIETTTSKIRSSASGLFGSRNENCCSINIGSWCDLRKSNRGYLYKSSRNNSDEVMR